MNYGFLGFFGILIVFGALLFLAYVTTKYVGNKAGKALRGKYMSIVETISIGLDKQLHLLKVGDEYILIASAGKNVEFLAKIDLNGVDIEAINDTSASFDFKGLFEKYLHTLKGAVKKDGNNESRELDSVHEGEVFKSNLDKLKTMNLRVNSRGKNDGDEMTNEE